MTTKQIAVAYLASLPDDKRSAISSVRELVLRSLPDGYVEGMGFGMINYSIPLTRFPNTYNGQALCYVALAAQNDDVDVGSLPGGLDRRRQLAKERAGKGIALRAAEGD